MKAYILTLPLGQNYGGTLQNYALQQALKRLGHSPETVLYRNRHKFGYYFHDVVRHIKHFWKYRDVPLKSDIHRRQLALRQFVAENIATTQEFNSPKALKEFMAQKTGVAVIVGSDQVWRPCYAGKRLGAYFLDFLHNRHDIRRISYAASFGSDQWEYKDKAGAVARELIQEFDDVSVRESSAVDLCAKCLGFDNAQWVPDPVLLLSAEDYRALYSGKANCVVAPHSLAVYLLDALDHKTRLAQEVSNCRKNWLHTLIPDINKKAGLADYIPLEEWLAGIDQAETVITDSFHGTVLSILFHKQFVVLANAKRGLSRLHEVLGRFGLEGRLLDENATPAEVMEVLERPIDYARVEECMPSIQALGYDFLKRNLCPQ